MAPAVDYDLGYQLRGGGGVIHVLKHAGIAGNRYLHGPADGADGAENIGCDWNVHIAVDPKSLHMVLYTRIQYEVRLAALGAARYRG